MNDRIDKNNQQVRTAVLAETQQQSLTMPPVQSIRWPPGTIAEVVGTTVVETGEPAPTGVYRCRIAAIQHWDDNLGDISKITWKPPLRYYYVLNLREQYVVPVDGYQRELIIGDLIVIFPTINTDREARWFGIPVWDGVRRAKITEIPAGEDTIKVYFYDKNGTLMDDYAAWKYDVKCFIAGGGGVDGAIPRLSVDDDIDVRYVYGEWFLAYPLQAAQDC